MPHVFICYDTKLCSKNHSVKCLIETATQKTNGNQREGIGVCRFWENTRGEKHSNLMYTVHHPQTPTLIRGRKNRNST
jgi:hypothetical protein